MIAAAALVTAAFAAPASLNNAKRQCSASTEVPSTVVTTTGDPVPSNDRGVIHANRDNDGAACQHNRSATLVHNEFGPSFFVHY